MLSIKKSCPGSIQSSILFVLYFYHLCGIYARAPDFTFLIPPSKPGYVLDCVTIIELQDDAEEKNNNSDNNVSQKVQKPSEEPSTGIATQLTKSHYPRNEIESARNATVFIETSWGSLGPGFIISKDCHVITNRHVMEFNVDEAVNEAKSNPELNHDKRQLSRNQYIRIAWHSRNWFRDTCQCS